MADVTVIGQTMFLRGSIRGDGDLEIHGRIEGDVEVGGEVTHRRRGAGQGRRRRRAASSCAAPSPAT